MELEDMQRAGEIIDWGYERISLQLTEATVVDGKRKRGGDCSVQDGKRQVPAYRVRDAGSPQGRRLETDHVEVTIET
jgi:hypothetical protein